VVAGALSVTRYVDRLGTPIWFFFFVPLLLVYSFGLLSLWVAYNRLRSGLTKSFLPRLQLLVNSTTNVFALTLFWLVFIVIYALAFFFRDDQHVNELFWDVLNFTVGSKGFCCLVVWMTVNSRDTIMNDDKEENIDANKSLREEVLQYATAGIRSAARAGQCVL
jgi:hypothetical protein